MAYQNPFAPRPSIPPELLFLLLQLSQQKKPPGVQAQPKKPSDSLKKLLGLGGGGTAAYYGLGSSTPAAPTLLSAKFMGGGASALPSLATSSPGAVGAASTPALELGALSPMSASGAATAATSAAGPTGLLTGASPALYFGGPLAGMAAFSALAPKVVPKVSKYLMKNVFGDRPDREYIRDEVVNSKLLNNQLPGWNNLDTASKEKISDTIQEKGLLSLPGGQGRYTAGPLQWDPNIKLRQWLPDAVHGRLENKFGQHFERTTPIEDLLKEVPTHYLNRMDQDKLGAVRGMIDATKAPPPPQIDEDFLNQLRGMFNDGNV